MLDVVFFVVGGFGGGGFGDFESFFGGFLTMIYFLYFDEMLILNIQRDRELNYIEFIWDDEHKKQKPKLKTQLLFFEYF